jgi:hypothetical protein
MRPTQICHFVAASGENIKWVKEAATPDWLKILFCKEQQVGFILSHQGRDVQEEFNIR